jgi:hypothetical protein
MVIKINEKEYEVKFTFNSIRNMEDFDFTVFETLEKTPFKMIPVSEKLLYAGLNHDQKVKVPFTIAMQGIEEIVTNGESLPKFIEELVKLLQESNFFKSLQENK